MATVTLNIKQGEEELALRVDKDQIMINFNPKDSKDFYVFPVSYNDWQDIKKWVDSKMGEPKTMRGN